MQSIILGEKITMTSYELVYKLVSVTRIPKNIHIRDKRQYIKLYSFKARKQSVVNRMERKHDSVFFIVLGRDVLCVR